MSDLTPVRAVPLAPLLFLTFGARGCTFCAIAVLQLRFPVGGKTYKKRVKNVRPTCCVNMVANPLTLRWLMR